MTLVQGGLWHYISSGLQGPVNRLRSDIRRSIFDAWFNVVLGSSLIPRDLRSFLLGLSGIKVASRANIYPGVRFKSRLISFGNLVMVNERVYFDNLAHISIEDSVSIGPEAILITSTHEMGEATGRAGRIRSKPITIKSGCWLGARVTVLPGVTIQDGCVVAAGSIVTRDTTPNGLYTGAPAKRVKELPSVESRISDS